MLRDHLSHVVLGYFAVVLGLLFGEEVGGVALLQQGVAFVISLVRIERIFVIRHGMPVGFW